MASAAPALPFEQTVASDAESRRDAVIAAIDRLVASCPGAGVVRKCSLESSLPVVEREYRLAQAAVATHLNTALAHRMLLTVCRGVERLSQVPPVKSRFDLDGYTAIVAEDATVYETLKEILAQHPQIVALLTPELRLGLALGSGALLCASKNAEKKSTPQASHGTGGGGSSVSAVLSTTS